MSLPLLIAINVLADAALIAGLAYAMSRAARLAPHVAAAPEAEQSTGGPAASPAGQPVVRYAVAQAAHRGTPVARRTSPDTAAASANR
jgi:hypothetical protein